MIYRQLKDHLPPTEITFTANWNNICTPPIVVTSTAKTTKITFTAKRNNNNKKIQEKKTTTNYNLNFNGFSQL